MTAVAWVVIPILIAVGSAVIAVFIMQHRMEIQLAKERQALAEARASIEAQKKTLEEVDRLREENATRRAVDAFLAEIRSEQRHFVREHKMLTGERRSLIVQERLYFRNLPLCNWVEHEATVEEGDDVAALARALSAFNPETLPGRDTESGRALDGVVEQILK